MRRGKKKAVGSSEPDALALSVRGFTDSTLVNGDSAPSNCNNNGNQPIIASPFPAPSNSVVADVSASQLTKLDEGFFEVEDIRRKRVRKGQLQYLVKWHGWPETANTWEPSDNLQSCSEFIEEFENRMEILRSGKQRKRKRKDGDDKKQHHVLATDNVTNVDIRTVDDRLSATPLNRKIHCDLATPQVLVDSTGTVDVENGHVDEKFDGSRQREKYDPKLSELKAAISANMVDSEKKAEASKDLGLVHDESKADCVVGSTEGSHSIGAKRRKSSRVKRFTKEAALSDNSEQGLKQNGVTVSIEPTDRNEQLGPKNPSLSGHSRNVSTITRIIKPVGYSVSVSNNIPDIVVTFLVVRSDGKEVTVNNKFLKANNPLLLINFYEQHLRYNPTL